MFPALGAWRFNRCTAGEAFLVLLTLVGRSGKWRGCRVLDLNHSTDSRFLRLPWGAAWGTVAVACGRPPPLEEESVVLLPGSKSCGKCRRLGGAFGAVFYQRRWWLARSGHGSMSRAGRGFTLPV